MTASNTHNVLTGFVLLVLLAGGLACARTYDRAQLEGTWDCTTPWTWDREDGASVPCSAEVHVTCREGKFSATSVIPLGVAQWDETSARSAGRRVGKDRTSPWAPDPSEQNSSTSSPSSYPPLPMYPLSPPSSPRVAPTTQPPAPLSTMGDWGNAI